MTFPSHVQLLRERLLDIREFVGENARLRNGTAANFWVDFEKAGHQADEIIRECSKLIVDIRADIAKTKVTESQRKNHLAIMDRAFQIFRPAKMGNDLAHLMNDFLNESLLASLEDLDLIISGAAGPEFVSSAERSAIEQELGSVRELLEQADLPDEVADFCKRALAQMQTILHAYGLLDREALQLVLQSIMAGAAIFGLKERVNTTTPWYKKLTGLLSSAWQISQVGRQLSGTLTDYTDLYRRIAGDS